MSDRLLDPPPEETVELVVLDPPDAELDVLEPPDEPVEYFVDVSPDDDCCLTSVPKSAQSPQTSSSAPSTFTFFGDDVSAPHISH
jgi:hypothetical protein